MKQSEIARGQQRPRWALTQALHQTIQQFALSWRALPPGAWQRWLRILVLGWAASVGLVLLLVWLARTLIADETQLFQRVVALIPFSFNAAIWIETPGNSVFLIPVMLAAAVVATRRGLPLHALSIVAAFALIDTVILLGWLVWDRPRPTLVYDGIAAPGWHSFPSGHVAQTVSMYGLFAYFWMRASTRRSEQLCVALLLALLIGAVSLSRLRLGAHWPSDVVAGGLIGAVWTLVIIAALRRAEAVQTQAAATAPSHSHAAGDGHKRSTP